MAAAPVELWSTRLSCPQIHGRISSLPQQLPSATLGEPENPSLNSDPGCIKVVDTYRGAPTPGLGCWSQPETTPPQFPPHPRRHRAYARERLDASGETALLARRHAEYMRALFQRAETEWETR